MSDQHNAEPTQQQSGVRFCGMILGWPKGTGLVALVITVCLVSAFTLIMDLHPGVALAGAFGAFLGASGASIARYGLRAILFNVAAITLFVLIVEMLPV